MKIVRKKKFICKVTVKQPVTSIKLNKTYATLNKGKSLTLITFLQKERELIAAQIMAKEKVRSMLGVLLIIIGLD